jgi:hypothetical protein
MDFIVFALTMVLSVALSAAAARIVLELVLQALWRSVEHPRTERLAVDGVRPVLAAAQLAPVTIE